MYSAADLLKLLLAKRGEYVRVEAGKPPILRIKEISHEVDGPAVIQEDLDQLIRELASTRQLREFRKTGMIDFTYSFNGSLFLIRVVQAFDEFRLDFLIIEKLRGNPPKKR